MAPCFPTASDYISSHTSPFPLDLYKLKTVLLVNPSESAFPNVFPGTLIS